MHAAEDDVDDHQAADPGDGDVRGDPRVFLEQGADEDAGTDHLGDHVEGRDGKGAERGCGADGPGLQAVGEQVGHGVFAGVAQRLGDDEEHGEVGDQEADRVHEAVEAEERDHPGDPEEGGGGHVVAGDGEAVLPAGDRAAGGEVGARTGVLFGAPDGDAQRGYHEGEKHDEGHRGG